MLPHLKWNNVRFAREAPEKTCCGIIAILRENAKNSYVRTYTLSSFLSYSMSFTIFRKLNL